MKIIFWLPFLVVALSLTGRMAAQALPVDVKFGNIDKADLALLVAPGDSTAEAYVLYDVLEMQVVPGSDGQAVMNEFRHRRIKLLTEASFDRADVEIVFHRETERVFQIKAEIHFPDGSSEKVSKRDIIKERLNDTYDVYKFTFPGVREGAILEYSWAENDDNIVVPARYFFQEDIPVRYAEYKALIPFMFSYVSLSNQLNKYDYQVNNVVKTSYGANIIQHNSIRWAMKDLPAYVEQPYVNNFSDYLPQVRMQLESVAYPGQAVQKVFSTWEQTTEKMYDWPEFGRAFMNGVNSNKVYREVESLIATAGNETEKAEILYNFVTSKITWDGKYRWTADKTPNQVYEAATGNSGEMSVLLLALLKQAGIEAHPLLVPLRNYGEPLEVYPLLTQFDHLMVMATLDGKPTVLDPNTMRRPMGLPRVSALNHRAYLAHPARPHWVDIAGPSASQAVIAELELDAQGMAKATLRSRLASYSAISGRSDIADRESDNTFPLMEDILEIFPDAEMVSSDVEDAEEVNGPLTFSLNLNVPIGQPIDDFLYVQPILCPVFEKGLADVDYRLYPVDFAYPWTQRYVSTLKIPEGYVVEEIPTSQQISSEDKTISCTFAIEDKGDQTLSINFYVSVTKTVYGPEEYATLRKIFRMIIDLQETTLILKRTK